MAGEGGFKSALNGFDKNEVNEYISNLRKTMKEMEAEKRANDEKTAAAVKTAEEAENRVKAAEKQAAEKIAELEIQAKTERRNAESMAIQIDELKRKLKSKTAAPAAAPGRIDTSAAEKKSAEIIAAANKTAQEVVEKAKKAANDIIASAQSTAAGASAGANSAASKEFMRVLGNYLETINSGFGEVSRKASELFGEASMPAPATPVTVPDFSNITAPQAEVPKSAPVPEKPAEPDMDMGLSGDFFATLTDDSSDDDMTAFGSEDIAPINPSAPKAEVLESFDLSHVHEPAVDEPVDAVKPLDSEKNAKAELDSSFMTDLIAQTVPSSALGNQVDSDLLAAVKEQEEKFAVKPADEGLDFNMDMDDSAPADNGGDDTEDPMAALLAQAQAAFGGGSFGASEPEPEPEPEPAGMGMGSSGDWADLQKQLEAMERSGNFGGDAPESAAAEPAKNIAEDPKAPSADDSAIWNFGDLGGGSSDDDDMSSDLFGNL